MHQHSHDHTPNPNEGKARFVVVLTFLVMLLEIGFGYLTNSVALLADGWHMGAHVLAIGLTWYAYTFERKHKNNKKFKNGTKKIFPLAGYTSSIILSIVALHVGMESVEKLFHPEEIGYKQAIYVAIIGLIVNGISAFVLHHDEHTGDHNIRGAYLHVLADIITSVFAIVALLAGYFWSILWLDAAFGLISAIIIGKWALSLTMNSGREILDYEMPHKHDHSH